MGSAKNQMEKTVKSLFVGVVLFSGLMVMAGPVQAQTTHYPAGVEGIKGASLPPPGFYLRDYNYIYFSDSFKEGPPAFDLFANVQAPRLIWITGKKVLGGYYGMDVIVPSGDGFPRPQRISRSSNLARIPQLSRGEINSPF